MEHKNCLICNSNEITILKGYEKHGLVKCEMCGFIFMKAIPTKEELDAHYGLYRYDIDQYLSPVTIESYNKLFAYFERFRKNNRILDVGCGQGWLLDIALKHNWTAYGTEFNSVALEKCKARGIIMHEGMLEIENYEPGSFDVIVLSEVIEHINNPLKELRKIHSLLRRGGLLYATTPNFNSYLRYQLKENYDIIGYPEHLSYYTKQTLNEVLQYAGFYKVRMETTGISLSHYNFTLTKESLPATAPEVVAKTADERLRKLMNTNSFMKLVKRSVNKALSYLGLGMTLKAYYIK